MMSDIICRIKLNENELPKITSVISELDGKGRNEMIRMFMRLALIDTKYPFSFNSKGGACILRLSVTKSSHPDLFNHLSSFPSRFRAAEVVRMLHAVESDNPVFSISKSETTNIDYTKTEQYKSKAPTSMPEYDDLVISESDMELAVLL